MNNTQYPDSFSRKRAERQRKRKKRALITFLITFILFLIATGVTLSLTIFFPIEKITVKQGSFYSAQEVLEASPIKTGDNLFAFSEKTVESKIRNKLPFIKQVKIERSLSGNVVFKITDAKKDVCFLKDKKYFVIGEDGFVLEKLNEKPEKLTVISGSEVSTKVGNYIKYNDDKKKEIIGVIFSSYSGYFINEIDLSDEYSINITVNNRLEVALGTSNNLKEKMAHLNSMVEKIDKNDSGKINLSSWSAKKPEGTFAKKEHK